MSEKHNEVTSDEAAKIIVELIYREKETVLKAINENDYDLLENTLQEDLVDMMEV